MAPHRRDNGTDLHDSSSISEFSLDQSDQSVQEYQSSPQRQRQGVLKPSTYWSPASSSDRSTKDEQLSRPSKGRASHTLSTTKKNPMSLKDKLESDRLRKVPFQPPSFDDSQSLEMTPHGLQVHPAQMRHLLGTSCNSPMQQSSRIFHTCFTNSPTKSPSGVNSSSRVSFDESISAAPSRMMPQIEFHVNDSDLRLLSLSNPPKIFDESDSHLIENDDSGRDIEAGGMEEPSSSSYLDEALQPLSLQQADEDAPERLIESEMRVMSVSRIIITVVLLGSAALTLVLANASDTMHNLTVYANVAAGLQLLALLGFAVFDRAGRRSQAKIMSHASKSTAIVASLFPKTVRSRLMDEASFDGSARSSKGTISGQTCTTSGQSTDCDSQTTLSKSNKSVGSSGTSVAFARGPRTSLKADETNRLLNFFDTGDFFGREPIADTFPHTTIMFLDIAGFTSWSAAREPVQVVRE